LLPRQDTMQAGDVLIGLPSSGPHANGFSLIRKLLAEAGVDVSSEAPFGGLWRDHLLAPTKIYVEAVKPLLERGLLKGMAHITGGGLVENIPRVLPPRLKPSLDESALALPDLFQWLQRQGDLSTDEVRTVFNCGIGMVLIAAEEDADAVVRAAHDARIIGTLISS
ncbi:MAG: AIR synthase-related protein, partial [Pseudomonadota bacterium]